MLRHDTSRRDLIAIIELLTALVTSGLEVDAVMKEVAERAAFLTGASGAVVEMAEGDEMVYRAVWGVSPDKLGLRLKRTGSLSGLCVELGVPLNCVDAETDPRVDREACRRVGVGSMICVPLSHAAQAVGVLKVFSSTRCAFDGTHLQTLRLLATVIASSLSNVRRCESADFERRHDALTGLRNRRAYDEDLAAEVARARRYERACALALLDLNGFKVVNDTHGHPAGDEVLRRTAGALRQSIRQVDRCYRVGGDEFAVLFPETTREQAQAMLQRILPAIAHAEMGVSAAAGVAELSGWKRASEFHRAADDALLMSKRDYYAGPATVLVAVAELPQNQG